MGRGPIVFVIQLFVSITVTAVGLWAATRPRHFQGFLNENYALVPPVHSSSFVTPTLIRMVGFGLLVYGVMLLINFRNEMIWLGKIFHVI